MFDFMFLFLLIHIFGKVSQWFNTCLMSITGMYGLYTKDLVIRLNINYAQNWLDCGADYFHSGGDLILDHYKEFTYSGTNML